MRPVDYDVTTNPPHYEGCRAEEGGPCPCAEIEIALWEDEMNARLDQARERD